MEPTKDLRLAVLIDADNVPYANIKGMLEEIAKYGVPTFKRIYADWTKPTVSGWKNVLLENSITPIHQYSYTSGKNATDSSMIIDAMDILYSGKVEGFCIVSSDSDFTRLASRLREAGMKVYGMGERKTPVSFISACDKFIYIEILKPAAANTVQEANEKPSKNGKVKGKKEAAVGQIDQKVITIIANAINDLSEDEEWVFLGDLGNRISKIQPDFDPRNYGFKKLVPLIKSINKFEVDERDSGKNNIMHVFVRLKK